MDVFLAGLQNIAMILLLGLLVAVFKYAIRVFDKWLAQKQEEAKNDLAKNAIGGIRQICDDVSASFDPIAEKFKKLSADGHLSQDDIDTLKRDSQAAALELVDELWSIDTLKTLGITEETIRKLIEREIEASLQNRKLLKAKSV